MKTLVLALSLACLGILGCTGDTHDLTPRRSPLVGTWEGYVEGYTFSSGSDRIQFAIATHDEATGAVTGTVTLGEGMHPPLATDPDDGYLVDDSGRDAVVPVVVEGANYSLTDADLEELRFRAAFEPFELWADWCALQTSYERGLDTGTGLLNYECMSQSSTSSVDTATSRECFVWNPDTMMDEPFDCGKLALCNSRGPCDCAAGGCTYEVGHAIAFDIALDGDVADGTIVGVLGPGESDSMAMHNVRLERME